MMEGLLAMMSAHKSSKPPHDGTCGNEIVYERAKADPRFSFSHADMELGMRSSFVIDGVSLGRIPLQKIREAVARPA